MNTPAQPARHSVIEDLQGIAFGTTMAAASITILTHLGLVTGQTAGLAVLLSYVTGWPFGVIFFVINLPFYWLGWQRMGAVFALKTFLAVGALSLLSSLIPQWISFDQLDPVFGAVLF